MEVTIYVNSYNIWNHDKVINYNYQLLRHNNMFVLHAGKLWKDWTRVDTSPSGLACRRWMECGHTWITPFLPMTTSIGIQTAANQTLVMKLHGSSHMKDIHMICWHWVDLVPIDITTPTPSVNIIAFSYIHHITPLPLWRHDRLSFYFILITF